MRPILSYGVLFALVAPAPAQIKTEVITYKHGDVELEGYFAVPAAVLSKQPADAARKLKYPGVLVIHEWLGPNAYARKRADMLAELGYVALALDMYGKGVRGQGPQDGPRLSKPYKDDRNLMRARAAAGVDVLRKHPKVDPTKLAAIGYCFGGTSALELARGGADLSGVVVFHGNLATPLPVAPGQMKARVLVCHGADDPVVPPAEVTAFQDEMRRAGADYQLISYGGAVHGFTNPGAGSNPASGVAYQPAADRRSWAALRAFFGELFP